MAGTLTTATRDIQNRATFAVAHVNAGKSFRRIPQLDTFRGFLLIWMTLTHLPTRVSAYSNQALGYVSAAEGFILLAAILISRIQEDASEKYGKAAADRKLRHRMLRIYGYHLALLAFAFFVGGAVAAHLNRVPLENLLDFYLQHPLQALLAAPALIYNPPLLDILPMYIVFMLLTPLVLRGASRWGWTVILAGSGGVWLMAQFHLREQIYAAAAHVGFSIPLRETGAFDLFGWQFLWMAGLFLGSRKAADVFFKARIPRSVLWLSAAIAVGLFLCRHANFELLTGPVLFDALVSKWRLGILRLIDAAAIGVLVVRFGLRLADNRAGARLAVLGRSSLEVFSAHVIFCLIFLGMSSGPEPHFALWQDVIIVAATLAGLFTVASRVAQRRLVVPAEISVYRGRTTGSSKRMEGPWSPSAVRYR